MDRGGAIGDRITPGGRYETALRRLSYLRSSSADLHFTGRSRRLPRATKDKAADHLSKGMVLAASGDMDGAIVEYRKALRINPDFTDAHNNLGLALEKNKNLDAAIVEFREALRVEPDDAVVHFNLGIALRARET